MKRIFIGLAVFVALFFLTGIILAYLLGVPPEGSQTVFYPIEEPEQEALRGDTFGLESPSSDEPGQQIPRVAIVIDDLGWVVKTAPILESFDAPLTMGLMPGRPRSQELYDRWQDRYEFILHQPMEPLGYPGDDPGDYALFTSMTREEIQSTVEKFLDLYPRIVGINNHMGSAFTASDSGMEAVMKILAQRGLYYLDSNTNPSSVADRAARKYGVPFLKNQIFLDRKTDPRYIDNQLRRLVELARREGEAIGIGHIQSENTARVLAHRVPQYQKQGIEFVSLSEIIDLPAFNYRTEVSR